MLKKLPQVLHIHLHLQKTVRFTHGAAIIRTTCITDATSGKPTGASKSAVAVELIYANDGSELPKFVSIAAGDYFSVALAEDGSV